MKMTSQEFERELLNGRCLIPLGKGYFTEVDSEDWDYLLNFADWYTCGNSNKTIYAACQINNIYYYMHKVIAQRMGLDISKQIDHKNVDSLDNKRNNLREATLQQNSFNSKISRNNVIGYKGVSFYKINNQYRARIEFNNVGIHLGYYNDPKEAYIEYCKAAFYYFGEFANYG